MSTVRTRFAPSPTGYLHVGGARTALFNWLYARHHGGKFVLRIEDSDSNRNQESAQQAILDGLRWLDIDWDEGPEIGGEQGPYFQSERQDIYEKWLEKLQATDRVYEDNGALRFRFDPQPVTIDDQVCGSVSFDPTAEPDMTIRRPPEKEGEKGGFIFHFVNVIDDIEMGITHVLRGEDHLSNTWKHLQIYQALEITPPVFAHIPLLLNEDGSKMSKRDEGSSIESYAEAGYLPEAVFNYLCLLGWNPKDDSELLSKETIVEKFDLAGINSANAKFDLEKCAWLNGQYLQQLSSTDFAQQAHHFLEAQDLLEKNQADTLLPLFQEKVRLFSELPEQLTPLLSETLLEDQEAFKKLAGQEGAEQKLQTLLGKLEELSTWNSETINTAVEESAAKLEVKKGTLMFPLRVASSGQGKGPDLLPMLEYLGQKKTLDRTRQSISSLPNYA